MKVNNIIDIKRQNILKIIELIKNGEGLLKKEISERTGLSVATVSNLCGDLKKAGLITEDYSENMDTSVGRHPKIVKLNKNSYFLICIDMHRSDEMRLVILNLANDIVDEEYFELKDETDLSKFIKYTRELCQECCDRSNIPFEKIIGVGAAVPAIFDMTSRNTVCSNIKILEDQPLKQILEDVYKLPAFVYNESNLCVVSKQKNEVSSGNIAYILCSEGLGTGVIANGRVITGYMGYAAEVCHIPIGDHSLICELCGQTGCVQSDLSISGFLSKYYNKQIPLNDIRIKQYWTEFLDKALNDYESVRPVIEKNSIIFGQLVSILVNMFDLEYVFIGGDIAPLFDKMLPFIEREVDTRRIGRGRKMPKILPDIDNNTIIIGCAEQVFRNVLPIK
ncbi:MAG: ROK family transcriptional regulator [Clostridiaceae bacterium]|nr:ROK family transcriptional regulator [Clostridiaceae bacterium]